MSRATAEDIRAFLLGHLEDRFADVGLSPNDVGDDFDLLAEGVIDSFGLLELLTAIEDAFEIDTDLSAIEVDDLGVIGPFCRHLASSGRARA